ncbi:MAG: hypothetical protein L0Y57_08965 [Beijerinckiaceae bacterium]|nr:hypothetical protein [Beijerinckiaceae bacterium]
MAEHNAWESGLQAAYEAGVIDAPAYKRLTDFLADRTAASRIKPPGRTPRFDFVNLLWYMGALIVLGAMSLFTTRAFGLWGPKALIATSAVYAACFIAAAAYLWHWRGLRTPGGLLAACAVGMVPLLIYGVQAATGNDPSESEGYKDFYVWIRSSWLPMEIGTILAAVAALVFFPFPFLVMPAAFALWFMSMDLTPWLLHTESFTFEQRANVSILFGLLIMAIAWLADFRRWKGGDFAFWLHLFGLLSFWGGLTAQESSSEIGKAIYCLINAGLVFLALFLMRKVYVVFGAVGISLYFGHLASDVFEDSVLFPFALSGIGLLVIGAGLLFHRYGDALALFLARSLPGNLRALRPVHARDQQLE